MGYRIFEHEDVIYKLFLGHHATPSYPMIEQTGGLKDLDVLVLEMGNGDELDLTWLRDDIQYGDILKNHNKENQSLVYYELDVPLKDYSLQYNISSWIAATMIAVHGLARKPQTRREFLGKLVKASAAAYVTTAFTQILPDNDEAGLAAEANGYITSALPTPIIGFRNAVVAEKILRYVVPKEEKPGSKLKVGIVYGAMHSGIEQCIKHKDLRDWQLGIYKEFGYPSPIKDLNSIRKIVGYPMWEMEEIMADIF